MTRETMVAQLLAARATIEAVLTTLMEEKRCCDNPRLNTNETYSGKETSCLNCGTVISRAPGGPNHEEVRSDGSRQTE